MQHLAKQVQSQGRGNDTMLVHMTPREVGGLQSLAKAAGGSLTTNPHTGLPEAGFLEAILPTIAGVALAATGIGAPAAALMVGAADTAITGDLGKGLMAGLGAFGGAGLGSALGGLGAAGGTAATGLDAAGQSTAFLANEAAGVAGDTAGGAAATGLDAAGQSTAFLANEAAGVAGDTAGVTAATGAANLAPGASAVVPWNAGSTADSFSNIGQGVENLGNKGGLSDLWTNFKGATNGGMLGDYGATAGAAGLASPFLMPEEYKAPDKKPWDYTNPFHYTPRAVSFPSAPRTGDSSEYSYFTPTNPWSPPLHMADGGVVNRPPPGYLAGRSPEFNYNVPWASDGARGLNLRPNMNSAYGQDYRHLSPGGIELARYKLEQQQAATNLAQQRGIVRGQPLQSTAPSGIVTGLATQPVAGPQGAQSYTQPRSIINAQQGFGTKRFAGGGETLRDGAFVVDARTVSELGNGSSGAGQDVLARLGGKPINGPGDGVSDSIRASVGGVQEARVARDEVKFEPEAVARVGGGDAKRGAKKLYAIMDRAHRARKAAKRGEDTNVRKGLAAI